MKKFIKVSVLICLLLITFVSISAEPVSATTSISSAKSIGVNKTTKGKLTRDKRKEYYKFTLKEAGNIELAMKNKSNSQWDARIINNKNKEYVKVSTDSSSNVSGYEKVQVGLPKGTYYVEVDWYWNANEVPYEFKLNYTKSNYYEKEFNDTFDTANSISLNKTYKGTVSNNDIDYFKVTLPKAGNVTLSMKNVANAKWDISIQDKKGNKYEEFYTKDSSNVTGNSKAQVGLPKGTYYIQVKSNYNARNKPYAFKVEYKQSNYYEKEFNDTLATANSIKLNKDYRGVISHSGDEDYFKVNVSSTGDVSVAIDNKADAPWGVRLYNSNGNQIESVYTDDSSAAKGKTRITKKLKKGTYYVKVNRYFGSQVVGEQYKFQVSLRSSKLKSKQVKVTNSKGKSDKIKVTGIKKGDVIKVYNKKSGGKQLASKKSTGTSTTLSVRQLGKKSGNVYVTIQKSGQKQSARTKVAYKGEKSSKLKAKQVKITNNKGKSDKIKVTGIKKGDVIKVYNKSKGGKQLASKKSKGKSVTLSVKQLGKKSGKVYVTVKKPKQRVSARTAVSYKAERR